MIVYHGSTIAVNNPIIVNSEIGRDFGHAFYTTDIKEQAERWANRRSRILSRSTGKQEEAVINVYEWSENENLKIKKFQGVSLEWLDFVVKCRSDNSYIHGYDIVEGKIANDNVGETVSYVIQGIMRPEDALERLKFEKINNQIAFCTPEALAVLTYKESYKL